MRGNINKTMRYTFKLRRVFRCPPRFSSSKPTVPMDIPTTKIKQKMKECVPNGGVFPLKISDMNRTKTIAELPRTGAKNCLQSILSPCRKNLAGRFGRRNGGGARTCGRLRRSGLDRKSTRLNSSHLGI